MSPPRKTVASSAPTKSRRRGACGSRVSGTARTATTTVTAATGRLIRKIHRQLAYSTRKPPRNGPIAEAMPPSPHPRADRLRPVPRHERTLDHREAAGCQERGAGALEDAGRDQDGRVRGQSAQQGGEREPHGADHEDPTPAVAVAERAAQQDQAGQREQVAVGDPLQLRQRGVEVLADRVQGDVDHRAVEHRHAGAEDGGGYHRTTGRRPESYAGRSGGAGHNEEPRGHPR